jgi:hypothetical protein
MSEKANLKLILLHTSVCNDTVFRSSIKTDGAEIVEVSNDTNIDVLDKYITEFNITHLTFIYHYPGYLSIPVFDYINKDESGNIIENNYRYMNDNIINLIVNINNPNLVVDLLSCNLNKEHFVSEMDKIQQELNVNIRYSVDQTGNNPQGNWVLESDNVNIKDLYFTEKINDWNGVLNSGRLPADIAAALPDYFSWDGTTLTLLQDIMWDTFGDVNSNRWDAFGNVIGWAITDYIQLGANEIFDGQDYTIDLSSNTTSGLFSTGGTSLEDGSVIKNLGVLNGALEANGGYIVRKEQSFFKLYKCYSTGIINGDQSGGICSTYAGNNGSCTITNCYSTGTINADGCGGICSTYAGNNGSCTITNCYSTGNINSIGGGGICSIFAGMIGSCTITNCYSTGNINGYVSGGICGAYAGSYGSCSIINCYSTGDIESNESGGICGSVAGSYGSCTITNCYSTGIINGDQSGGICGTNAGNNGSCTITNCYSQRLSGNITSGSSDGTTPIDGNYPLIDLLNLNNTIILSIPLNSEDTDVSGNQYILSADPDINYPKLKTFTEEPWDASTYNKYNDSALLLDENSIILTPISFNNSSYIINLTENTSTIYTINSNDISNSNLTNNDISFNQIIFDISGYNTSLLDISSNYNGSAYDITITSKGYTANQLTSNITITHPLDNTLTSTQQLLININTLNYPVEFINNNVSLSFNEDSSLNYNLLSSDISCNNLVNTSLVFNEFNIDISGLDTTLLTASGEFIDNTYVFTFTGIPDKYGTTQGTITITHPLDNTLTSTQTINLTINNLPEVISFKETTLLDLSFNEDSSLNYRITPEDINSADLSNGEIAFTDFSFNISGLNDELLETTGVFDSSGYLFTLLGKENKHGITNGIIHMIHPLDSNITATRQISVNVVKQPDTIEFITKELSLTFNEDTFTNYVILQSDISSVDLINKDISFTDFLFDISGLDTTLLTASGEFVNNTYVFTFTGVPDRYGTTQGTITITHPSDNTITSTQTINLTINNLPEVISFKETTLLDLSFNEDSSLNYRITPEDINSADLSNGEIAFTDLSFNISGLNDELLETTGVFDSSGYLFTFVGKENKHGITNGIINMIHPLDSNITATRQISVNVVKQPDTIEFITKELSLTFNEDTFTNYVILQSDISSVDLINKDISFTDFLFDISGLDTTLLSVSGEFVNNTYVFRFTGVPDRYGSTSGIVTITHPSNDTITSTQTINLNIINLPEVISFKNNELLEISLLEDSYTEYRITPEDINSADLSNGEIAFTDLSFNISGLNDELIALFGEFDSSGYLFNFVGRENVHGITNGIINMIHPLDSNITATRQISVSVVKQPDPMEFIDNSDVDISFYEDSGYNYDINLTDISSIDITNGDILLSDLIVDISGIDSNLITYTTISSDSRFTFIFKGVLDQYGTTSGIITLTHPLDSNISISKTINITVTDVPEYIDNNVYTDTLTNTDTVGVINKETVLDRVDLGDYILTIKLHKEDSTGKYDVGIPYSNNITISEIYLPDGIGSINTNINSYNEEIANISIEFNVNLTTYSDISYINVTMTENTTAHSYDKKQFIDNSNVLIELNDISLGNYSIKLEIYDNDNYYVIIPENYNKVINQMNSIDLYSNNILTKILSYNDSTPNIKTSFYLDIEKYQFDSGVYELSGVNINEYFTTTLTRDTSNIDIITNNVPYGEYIVKMNFYDASGLHITPKYESTITTNKPVFSKFRLLTLNTPNTIDNYEYKLVFTNDDLSLNEINEKSVRFYNYSDDSELKYFIEKYDANSEIIIWLSLPLNIQTIKMNYENHISSNSNGKEVFKYFDDFNNNDLNEWAINGGSYSYVDGKLVLTNSNTKVELTNIDLSGSYIEIKSNTRLLNDNGYSVFDISSQDNISGIDIGLTNIELINKSPLSQIVLDNSASDTTYNGSNILNKDIVYQMALVGSGSLESSIHNSDGLLFGIDDTTLPNIGETITNWSNVTGDTNYDFNISEENKYPTVIMQNNNKMAYFDYNDLRTQRNIIHSGQTNYTVMMVARIKPGNLIQRVLAAEEQNWLHGYHRDGFTLYFKERINDIQDNNTEYVNGSNIKHYNEFHITTSTKAISDIKYTIHGTVHYQDNVNGFSMPQEWVLGGKGQFDEQTRCEVACLYVWDRVLSDAEIINYESLLAKKYGIQEPYWMGPSPATNYIKAYDFNNNNELFINEFGKVQLLNNDNSLLNYSLYLNNNTTTENLNVEYDWLRIRNSYETSYTQTISDISSTSIINNISNTVSLYTDEIANITVSFDINTTLYEYDIINIKVIGTDISTNYTTFTTTPTIEINNIPFGSNLLEITLLTNEGLNVSPTQLENIFVEKPSSEYIDNYSFAIYKNNENVVNSKLTLELSSNIIIENLQSIKIELNNLQQTITNITFIDGKYEFIVNGLVYDNNELKVAFMNNNGYYITPTQTINKIYNNTVVNGKIIDSKINLDTSEGTVEDDNNNNNNNNDITAANLNGTNLEDITIINEDGDVVKIISKVDNVYYLLRNISWYEIVQVNTYSEYINLYDGQVFDGNGFTIDLVTNSSNGIIKSNSSTFDNPCIIRNLGVLNGKLYSNYQGYILCRYSNNFILDRCYSTGDINTRFSGGLVGSESAKYKDNKGIIKNCYTTGNITATYSGGIVGSKCGSNFAYLEIDSCYTTGNIANNFCGSITGSDCAYSGGSLLVKNCIGYNNISRMQCGGIVGYRNGHDTGGTVVIQNCYFAGTITYDNFSGAILSSASPDDNGVAIVQNCYSNVEQTGTIGSIFTSHDSENASARVMQLCYGNSSITANTDSFTSENNNYYYPNYNISNITGNLDKINNATSYTYYGDQHNTDNPILNSSGVTITNEGGAYVIDDNLPLLKSFIESSSWDTSNYNEYTDKPELLIGSINAEQTNYRVGGCDLLFDLVIPNELYSSVSRVTIEGIDSSSGEILSNEYNVSLTSSSYRLLLKNTVYTSYDILIKLYDADGYYIVQPHKLFVLSIKPDGMKVSSFNTIIAENDTTELVYKLTATNPTGAPIRYEMIINDELVLNSIVYDSSFGKVSFNGIDTIKYKPNPNVYGTDRITYISRDIDINLPSNPGSIEIYIDAAPLSSDKYININQGDTTSIILDAYDPQNGDFNVSIVKQPTKGTLTKVNDLTYTYVSNGVEFGEDSIGYILSDNYTTSKVYYSYIQINSATNSLSKALNGSYTCERGQSIYIDLYSTDANADKATFKVTSYPENGYINKTTGVMRMDLNKNYKGTLLYRAAQDFSGIDIFKFAVDDGIVKSVEGTISINCINSIPEAKDISIKTILNTNKEFLLNGLDLNRDNLVYTYQQPSHGTITSIYGKYVSYSPDNDYVGEDSFTYTVSDGYSTSNIATVSILVEDLNNKLLRLKGNIDNDLPNEPQYRKNKFEEDIKEKIIQYSGFAELINNYSTMIYKYRSGAKIKVTNDNGEEEEVDVNQNIKKTVRKQIRKQLNDFGYSNIRFTTPTQKNNIINSANSVATDINPFVYQREIVSLIPDPDSIANNNVPVYNLDENNLDTQNLYFDINEEESIKLNFGDEIREFKYVVDKDDNDNIIEDYLEDSEGNIYKAGDNIIINRKSLFILALGSVMISGGDVSSSSGDPYITTLTKETYKMKEQPGIYRMFDGENLIINAEVDWISNNHKEKILEYFNHLPNVVTRGILYKYLYLENEGEKLVIDFVNRKVHTSSDNKTIEVGSLYEDYSQSPFYKTIKCKKIPVMLRNKHHGNIRFTIELYENPQIDSGLSIQVEKYKLDNITGLLVDTYKESDMKVNSLDDIVSLRNNTYERENKKHIIEKHETWYYMK